MSAFRIELNLNDLIQLIGGEGDVMVELRTGIVRDCAAKASHKAEQLLSEATHPDSAYAAAARVLKTESARLTALASRIENGQHWL